MRHQKRISDPEDIDQRLVITSYGKGLVVRTRNSGRETNAEKINSIQKPYEYFSSSSKKIGIQEIRLLDWHSATLYSSADISSITPEIGFDVISQFGRGIITGINDVESKLPKKYVISLTSWRLANRSLVKCYLTESSFCVVRKKVRREMNAYDKVMYAQKRKKDAAIQFSKGEYSPALMSYSDAVNVVRYVQHDSSSTNELRADLLEVMVTCNNNAATCCIKLKQWNEAKRFSTNAMILLDALYNKRGMKIHGILNKDGLTDPKLFGEWRGKSLTIVAKSWMNLKDYEQAIQWLKKAKECINPYFTGKSRNEASEPSQKILMIMDKEINKLLHHSMQKKKAIDKKEKLRAKAMFGGPPSSTSSNTSSKKVVANRNRENISTQEFLQIDTNKSKIKSLPDEKVENDLTGDDQPSPTSILRQPSFKESDTKIKNEHRVKFGEGVKEGNEYIEEDDEFDEPWYKEHKEALIIAGAFLAGATLFLRPRK